MAKIIIRSTTYLDGAVAPCLQMHARMEIHSQQPVAGNTEDFVLLGSLHSYDEERDAVLG